MFISIGSSCKKETKSDSLGITYTQDSTNSDTDADEKSQIPQPDTLSLNNTSFDKHSLFQSRKEVRDKIDSTVYKIWECGNPFEWMDEEADNDSIYHLYQDGKEYITNGSHILLYKAYFKNHRLLIKNKNVILSESTTLEQFKVLFPTSFTHWKHKSNEYDKLQVSFNQEVSEDGWRFYFKNGYLYKFELYWWIC